LSQSRPSQNAEYDLFDIFNIIISSLNQLVCVGQINYTIYFSCAFLTSPNWILSSVWSLGMIESFLWIQWKFEMKILNSLTKKEIMILSDSHEQVITSEMRNLLYSCQSQRWFMCNDKLRGHYQWNTMKRNENKTQKCFKGKEGNQ
jgi:hypothetical protein